MKATKQRPYSVQVDLPSEAFLHHPWEPQEIAQQMRLFWLIELVRQRRLGYGKAAELAAVPKALFIKMMGKRGVSPVDYDPDELAEEFRAASELSRK